MQADAIDPQAEAALERQERFPIPRSRLGLKLARLSTGPAMWFQNRLIPRGRTAGEAWVPYSFPPAW